MSHILAAAVEVCYPVDRHYFSRILMWHLPCQRRAGSISGVPVRNLNAYFHNQSKQRGFKGRREIFLNVF